MRPARARKTSTTSDRPGKRSGPTRYLGLEVAGEPVPSVSPGRWLAWLSEGLASAGAGGAPLRVIRSEGARAIVRVRGRDAPAARRAWNGTPLAGGTVVLRTVRTWGTLVGAKAWLGPGRRRPRTDEDPT